MLGEKLAERYEAVAELGRGGMGVVYRARDPLLNREVAVKVISPSLLTPETEQRFQSEAQLVAQMDHPAIVSIYDFGRHNGSLFFVMPIVVGDNLRTLLRKRALTLGTMVDVGIGVAEALEYSHSRGVVHRDIKPENIMVALEPGGEVRLRIMDFGLARGSSVTGLTKTGMLLGTMSYISPEQVTTGRVDGRSDIYSLGCVLYECLVGEVPFTGEMQSVLYRVVHETPQAPRERGVEVDPELEEIVLACLAKDPARRPAKAGDLARRLRAYRAKLRETERLGAVLLTEVVATPRPVLAPFTGREAELAELQQRLNAALRGECQFVVVGGEAGVGKSRLLAEIEALAKARDIRVLHGRFMEQHGAFPYIGFCELIQEYFRQKENASSSSGPLDLSDIADDLVALFPMLAEVDAIRSAARTPSTAGQLAEARSAEGRTEVFELLARTLIRLAVGRPVVMLLEDLQGAEASLEALQYIVRRLGPTPTLIVGTYRTTEVDRRHPITQMVEGFRGDRRFAALTLGPLTRSEHRKFLSTLTGGSQVAEELAAKIFEATEGNPFFTKELVRSLLDSGGMTQDATGAWRLSGGVAISSDALPATIQQAVEARITRLPDELRDVLAVASVLGRRFDFEDLEALAEGEGKGGGDLEDTVDRLIREGLLEEDRQSRGDRLAFASGVVREVLYASLARRRRRSLHRRFAERLERRQAGRLEPVYAQLLYHFSEGDVPEKTVEYGLLHAQRSLVSFSPEEVIRAAKTAVDFLDEGWEGDRALEGQARMLLAAGFRMAGDLPAALKETLAAVKVFEQLGRRGEAAKALLAAARTTWQARQIEETRRWVELGIEAARGGSENDTLAQLLSLGATLANLRGEYTKGNEYLREADRLIEGKREKGAVEDVPRGGRLVVPLAGRVKALAPIDLQLTEEFEVFANVFETLLTTDEEGNLHPGLAESWELRDDGRAFRFTLRPDVALSDGRPLRGGDVRRAFEQAIRASHGDLPPGFASVAGAAELAANRAQALEGVAVTDDRVLEVRLVEPLPIYPTFLTDRRTAVALPPASGTGPLVGSGPFRIAAQDDARVVLERNDAYWRGAPAKLDAIEFRCGLSPAAITAGLRAGELDMARDLLPSDLDEVLRDPRFHAGLIEAPQKFTYFALFNCRSGPLAASPGLRRALVGLVHSRDLVWRTAGRFAAPATGLIPPGILGHDPGRRERAFGVAEARELVWDADAEGLRLRVSVHPLVRERYQALLDALFAAWAEAGVGADVVTSGMDDFLRSWPENEGVDVLIARWKPDVDDPDGCTHTLFHSGAGLFRAYYTSSEADQLLAAARREHRPAMRAELYRRFEGLLADEAVLAPLLHDIGYRVVHPRVHGAALTSIHPYVNYAQLGKAEAAAAAPAPRTARGTIHVPVGVKVTSLDPAIGNFAEEVEVNAGVFETLLRDSGEARIEPWLAASYRIEEGGRVYRFRLRNDVTFHDGRRLTVRDVRYSIERLLQCPDSEYRSLCTPMLGAQAMLDGAATTLAGFRIHSASEFSIELERPVAFFAGLLSHMNCAILPEGTGRIGDGTDSGAIGTGPFRVVRFEPGVRLELERNPTYWRRGLPRAERLVYHFDVRPEDALKGLRSGRFSIAGDLYPADVEALRRDAVFAAGYRDTPRFSTYFVAFNCHRGPLADAAVRRQLVAAVDVSQIVGQTLGALAVPAHGLIPPGLLGHDPHKRAAEPRSGEAPHVEVPAAELSAGVHPVFTSGFAAFSGALLKAFNEVGVTIRAVNQTREQYLAAVMDASIDISVGRWIADYPDADSFAYLLHTTAGLAGRMCGTPKLDALLDRGRAETDAEARHAIYREVEEIVAREALILPLFHEQSYRFARPDVEGLTVTAFGPTVAYEQLAVRPT
ncbi:MAG TPA: ABC transporter substrate-binding protein [Thermoanaerobaculaceae bacterium]|nr:ABC transporter substrate-binding protein [Thermoanaerobaculaceae bacterium]